MGGIVNVNCIVLPRSPLQNEIGKPLVAEFSLYFCFDTMTPQLVVHPTK